MSLKTTMRVPFCYVFGMSVTDDFDAIIGADYSVLKAFSKSFV